MFVAFAHSRYIFFFYILKGINGMDFTKCYLQYVAYKYILHIPTLLYYTPNCVTDKPSVKDTNPEITVDIGCRFFLYICIYVEVDKRYTALDYVH